MEMDKKEVGSRIKSIRINLKETTAEFAKRFTPPASDSLVSRWERGVNLPNSGRLKQIADLGGYTVDELLYGSNSIRGLFSRIDPLATSWIDQLSNTEDSIPTTLETTLFAIEKLRKYNNRGKNNSLSKEYLNSSVSILDDASIKINNVLDKYNKDIQANK